MSVHSTLDIKLLGREYRVSCPPDEREALLEAVAYLEGRMTDLAAKTKGTGERLAVMTALNLAHELLAAKSTLPQRREATTDAAPAAFDGDEYERRIKSMVARLDEAMIAQDKLF